VYYQIVYATSSRSMTRPRPCVRWKNSPKARTRSTRCPGKCAAGSAASPSTGDLPMLGVLTFRRCYFRVT